MHLEISSEKRLPFCPGGNELNKNMWVEAQDNIALLVTEQQINIFSSYLETARFHVIFILRSCLIDKSVVKAPFKTTMIEKN